MSDIRENSGEASMRCTPRFTAGEVADRRRRCGRRYEAWEFKGNALPSVGMTGVLYVAKQAEDRSIPNGKRWISNKSFATGCIAIMRVVEITPGAPDSPKTRVVLQELNKVGMLHYIPANLFFFGNYRLDPYSEDTDLADIRAEYIEYVTADYEEGLARKCD